MIPPSIQTANDDGGDNMSILMMKMFMMMTAMIVTITWMITIMIGPKL